MACVGVGVHDIREICKQSEQSATLYGLTINTKKTVTLYQPPPGQTTIDPHVGTPLKSIKNFTYLGSTVASDNTIDVEINSTVFKLPLERLEDRGCVYGHNMVFQSPQSATCTSNCASNTTVFSRDIHSLSLPF